MRAEWELQRGPRESGGEPRRGRANGVTPLGVSCQSAAPPPQHRGWGLRSWRRSETTHVPRALSELSSAPADLALTWLSAFKVRLYSAAQASSCSFTFVECPCIAVTNALIPPSAVTNALIRSLQRF